MKNMMTFKEYADLARFASNDKYRRNVTYYDPCKGWVLDLTRKINNGDLPAT